MISMISESFSKPKGVAVEVNLTALQKHSLTAGAFKKEMMRRTCRRVLGGTARAAFDLRCVVRGLNPFRSLMSGCLEKGVCNNLFPGL